MMKRGRPIDQDRSQCGVVKRGYGNACESDRARQGDPEPAGIDPREWAGPHGFCRGDQSVPRVGHQFASAKVPYTFWHLVEHIRLAQKDMLDYMVSTSYEEPAFPQGYWPGKGT